MSKQQLLIIEPAHELKFVGPFCTAVSSFMRLTNPTEHVILFKIKTTAPKKYCVRPNCGILEPKDTIEITIVLQPFIFEAAEKNKHKFMVQSMIMPEGDVHIDSVWKDCNPANLMDSKLRCVFELPEEKEMTLSEMAELGGANKREVSDPAVPDDTPKKNVSGGLGASELQSSAEKDKSSGGSGNSADGSDTRKLLEEAATNLRHENMILKESLLRLQLEKENISKELAAQSSSAKSSSSGAAVPEYANVYRPPALAAQQQIPIVYVAAAIALAVFGFILGKFVL
uniref:Putative vesicle-associated membrane protein/synaptobrevin-binding protein n=2 Tax=Culex tarsalis TaxID=7177 RepID=A0A1Q3EU89_CULTA